MQTLTNNYVPRTCAELVHTVKDTREPWGGGGGRGWGEEAVEEAKRRGAGVEAGGRDIRGDRMAVSEGHVGWPEGQERVRMVRRWEGGTLA